jgi:hypothetical protein
MIRRVKVARGCVVPLGAGLKSGVVGLALPGKRLLA